MITGSPDRDGEDATTMMAASQIRRLPIVENDKVVGIVSLGDIAFKDPFDADAETALEEVSEPARPKKRIN